MESHGGLKVTIGVQDDDDTFQQSGPTVGEVRQLTPES